jgi:hypothetical protein
LAILILAVSQTKWKNVVYGNVVAGGMGSNKMEKWLRGYHQSWLRGEVCHLSSSNTLASQYWTLTKIEVQVISLSLSLSHYIFLFHSKQYLRWCEIYLNIKHEASSISFLTNLSTFSFIFDDFDTWPSNE